MSITVNFGIVGPGRVASNCFGPALSKVRGGQLWSVFSRDLSRAADFAEQHRAQSPTSAYDDLDKMLSDPDLHAIVVCTPDKLHAEVSLLALRAGKHVFVEKPISVDSSSAREMIETAKNSKRCLAVGYGLRWHAGHRNIRQKVLDGFLGRLHHMRASFTWQAADGDGWRTSPELGRWWSMAAAGTHCLDLIRWFMLPSCGEISDVVSLLATGVWNSPHDETALVNLKFESGATAEFTSSALYRSPSRIEVYGDKGFFICEETLNWRGTGRIFSHEGEIYFQVVDPFVGELENFVDAIINSCEPEVGGAEALRNVEILEEAARLGGLPCYA